MHLAVAATTVVASSDPTTEPTLEDVEMAIKLDPTVAESIKQGIADLTEMAPCHQFAEQALNILKYLAQKWKIEIGPEDTFKSEEYDRLGLTSTDSLNFFAPNVRNGDILCQWGTGETMIGSASAKSRKDTGAVVGAGSAGEDRPAVGISADTIENPLFWPFPWQGRPILPTGKALKQAGFALI